MLNIIVTESAASRFLRCASRSATMLSEGYTVAPFETCETCFYVTSPTANLYTVYTHICFPQLTPSCSCPDFEKHGDFCKHILLIDEVMKGDEAQKWESICREVDRVAALEDAF